MTTIDWRVSDVPFDQSEWNYGSDPISIKIQIHTDVEFDRNNQPNQIVKKRFHMEVNDK